MADLTKPAGMSDELWADIEDDFNGEDATAHRKYFTIGDGETLAAPTQDDLETLYEVVQPLAPEATAAVELEYKTFDHQRMDFPILT